MPRGRAMIPPDGARPSPCEPPIDQSRFPASKKPSLREPLCLVRFELRCGESDAFCLSRRDVQVPSGRSKHTGSTSQGCPCWSKRRTPTMVRKEIFCVSCRFLSGSHRSYRIAMRYPGYRTARSGLPWPTLCLELAFS